MKLDLFFATHPIFTVRELRSFFDINTRTNSTLNNLLLYHHEQGHILSIRRGLYAVIPKEAQGFENLIDPYLIASKLADDSILAYHTALSLHGKGHTLVNHFYYLTHTRIKKKFEFQGNVYQGISIPSSLKETKVGIIQMNRQGMAISITSLERTFVDILDRPNLCLSWEEIIRSIESIEYLNIEAVLKYTTLLGYRTTAAIVGFFLELYQEKWMVSDVQIKTLQKLRPKNPFYLERLLQGPFKLIPSWNLIIPRMLLNKNWEEPHENI